MATLNTPLGLENGYGPIETVIHGIDKGLHRLGYRSTVACSGDSVVAGEKFTTVPESLGGYCSAGVDGAQERVTLHLSRALERARAGDIDVVHMHEWYERVYAGSFAPRMPIVMTLHVPEEHSGMAEFHDRHPAAPLASNTSIHWVAISDHQRRQYAGTIPIGHTIHHGIDLAKYEVAAAPSPVPYLFSIGRISSVKGQDTAIDVARKSGRKLILAGYVQDKAEDRAFFSRINPSIDLAVDLSAEPVGADYYERVMKPILESDKQIILVGQLNEAAKKHWYQHALATLFPIRWGEPFGMVLIESMACGTPVIAFREGAVPEILVDGKTGFIVDSLDAMVRAVGQVASLARQESRAHVERGFSIDTMAARYGALYEEIVRKAAIVPATPRAAPTYASPNRRQPALTPA